MVVLAAVLLGGCSTEPPPRWNLVVLLIDTLRADHLSVYGYERPTSPYLEQLADEGVLFERARSQSACTYPSVNSLLTSRFPFDFYRRNDGMGIPEQYPSLAEMLKANGYRTWAVSASPVVRVSPTVHNPTGGFGRGFDSFDETCLWQPAACLNRRAVALLEGQSADAPPFFLYLHYMDPHGPYQPPAGYQRSFAGAFDGPASIRDGDLRPLLEQAAEGGPITPPSSPDLAYLQDLYDDEIRYLDQQLQLLVEGLRRRGLLERTVLVLLADHGEAFWEHRQLGHCRGVWDSQTRTPLLLRWPGGPRGRRISSAVQNLDLVPTVLELLGINTGDQQLAGQSLLPLLDSPGEQRLAFADYGAFRSVDDGRHKLVLDAATDQVQLFDLQSDPGEQTDLCQVRPDVAQRLGHHLGQWLESSGQLAHFQQTLDAGDRSEEQLRALGYLW